MTEERRKEIEREKEREREREREREEETLIRKDIVMGAGNNKNRGIKR